MLPRERIETRAKPENEKDWFVFVRAAGRFSAWCDVAWADPLKAMRAAFVRLFGYKHVQGRHRLIPPIW